MYISFCRRLVTTMWSLKIYAQKILIKTDYMINDSSKVFEQLQQSHVVNMNSVSYPILPFSLTKREDQKLELYLYGFTDLLYSNDLLFDQESFL